MDAEQRRAQRRDQLLDAALELFAAQGYQNSSIEQICSTAYVSTKSFYELFDGREDCYLGLMRRQSERTFATVGAAIERTAGLPLSEATAVLLDVFTHALVDDPRVAKVLFGEGGAISWASERQRRANRRLAASMLEQVWRRYGGGDVPDDSSDVHGVAVGAVGGMFDIVADWLVDADVSDPAAVDALIARLNLFYNTVLAGLLAS